MVTKLVPLNDRALPKRPDGVQLTPLPSEPVLPLPETSATMPPAPSENEYAATRPLDAGCVDGGAGADAAFDTVTATFAEVVVLPTASRARAERVWPPLLEPPVVQDTEKGAVVCSAPSGAP